MKKILISGAKPLNGHVNIQGSKNAALPIIFASLSMSGTSTVYNVPDIGDVACALEIISRLGAEVKREKNKLTINTDNVFFTSLPSELISKIRASTYLIGACLARFNKSELMSFGGCNFGKRPIDLHIDAAVSLGAKLNGDGELVANGLFGAQINLKKPSVGATINSLIMSSSAKGISIIKGYAKEPHVQCLIDFLRSGGADITESDGSLTVVGRELHGGTIEVIPDMIEAGTYLLLSPLLGGKVSVDSRLLSSLSSFLGHLCASGIRAFSDGGRLWLESEPNAPINVTTGPYPEYPTDLQPQMAPLMAKYYGGSLRETVWLDRFGYLKSLAPFGIKYEREESFVRIFRSELCSCDTVATDLRGGAACLLCALMTAGESNIYNAEIILRGYSDLYENLSALGADINIV